MLRGWGEEGGGGVGWGKTQTVKLVNLVCPSENDGTETES